jgi:5-methylcytosine-specific restriction endonuclease McrA
MCGLSSSAVRLSNDSACGGRFAMTTKICQWCGREFIPTHGNQKTCSEQCKREALKNKPSRLATLRHFSLTKCLYCGIEFIPTYPNQKCCCTKHGDLFYKATVGNQQKREQRAEEKAKKGLVYCQYCGEGFIPKLFGHSKYCCKEHKKIYERKNRRALEHGVQSYAYSREQVFKRDHYICCLCNQPLNMSVTIPAWDAPTIDHILPLTKGGSDDLSNVQSAHYRCNCKKGNRK